LVAGTTKHHRDREIMDRRIEGICYFGGKVFLFTMELYNQRPKRA